MFHPRKNDQGYDVKLNKPSVATPMSAWADPRSIACVIPDGEMPPQVNGLQVGPWANAPTSIAAWEALASTMHIAEPPFVAPVGYKKAAGVVISEPDGRVWVVSPSNAFAGYDTTFPKGSMDGKTAKATAIAEAFEESGLQVSLTKFLIDVKRSASYTRYFLGVRTGGNPARMGWESQAVHLVPEHQLCGFVSHPNDKPILTALDAAKMRSLDKTDLLKTWTLDSVSRILTTVAGFRGKYGSWPTRILVHDEMADAIKNHVLTVVGWSLLAYKLELIKIKQGRVIAECGDGERFEYSDDNDLQVEIKKFVSEWIWGVDLTKK